MTPYARIVLVVIFAIVLAIIGYNNVAGNNRMKELERRVEYNELIIDHLRASSPR